MRNLPLPLRLDRRPVLVIVRPLPLEVVYTAPFGLTVPWTLPPMILPLVTTMVLLVLREQVVPTTLTSHAPSKLPPPPPPPLLREARRGSSGSGLGLLRRAGRSVSTARGARDPDSDLSSLPMLPPVLPDCARLAADPNVTEIKRENRPILTER